jgi:hypothetical protein
MCKDSITITKEQFANAVVETMTDIMNDPRIEGGVSKLLIPLTGATFAGQMREKLFGKPDNNETEEKKED